MRVLVFAHRLELGGTQTNAIELAAAVRDRFGVEVVLFATPGPAEELAKAHGLGLLPAPAPRVRPSAAMIGALRSAVRQVRADLVHAWDWPQVLDAYYGVALTGMVPLLGTSMSMSLERFLPRSVPMTFGTAEVEHAARRVWRSRVMLVEPPVDTERDRPGAVDAEAFRRRFGLEGEGASVVIVSRLAHTMKLEGILRAVDAVAGLATCAPRPVRLVIVGDGAAAGEVAARAEEANRRAGRRVVVVVGAMSDPRPVYAAADVVLGMGGSALRAMAFAKPVVLLGERGFSEIVEPATIERFLWSGFYGVGAGPGGGRPGGERLRGQIEHLLGDPVRRQDLGAFGRRVAVDRFGLEATAGRLAALYGDVVSMPARRRVLVSEAVRSLAVRSGGSVVRRRGRGTAASARR